uniref:LAGLIDADG endonuclease domain-containing protein n=1 Tax=Uncinula necator TaxID=52586 RepID=A0A7U1GFP8_UNCNE|nr:LAGLIDADG endonuclease domain-containing protein [Erysiphe necator]QQY98216.1 LAGLIDADG endonuclease domain-containing protein [Erysiphe necator]
MFLEKKNLRIIFFFLHQKLVPGGGTGWLSVGTRFLVEGTSFKILVRRNKNYKNWYSVSLRFSILLHEKDLDLLKRIHKYFGVGIISKQTNYNAVEFNVNSIDHLMVIIYHFNKYPLLTSKQLDLKLWSLAAKIISNKEHLTELKANCCTKIYSK